LIASLASACATVRTFSPSDLDTMLRTETETRVEESTHKEGAVKITDALVTIRGIENDTCYERKVDVVDRTTTTVRKVSGAGMHGIGAVVGIIAGTVAVIVAPTLSAEKNTTTNKETGKTSDAASNQTMAYVGGGIAIAGGLGSAGWLGMMALDATDTVTHVGEVRLEGVWSQGVACNERPMAGQLILVMYGQEEMGEIASGTTDSEGMFSFPRETLAQKYARSTSLEYEEFDAFIGGERLVTIAAKSESFEKYFGAERAAYISGLLDEAVTAALEAIEGGETGTANIHIEECHTIVKNHPRCRDLEGLLKCTTAVSQYKSGSSVGTVWGLLESVRLNYSEPASATCVEQAQASLRSEHEKAQVLKEAEWEKEMAENDKNSEKLTKTEGSFTAIFNEYTNGSQYGYWEMQYPVQYLDAGEEDAFCEWRSRHIRAFDKGTFNSAMEHFCIGYGQNYSGDKENCLKKLKKPSC